MKKRKKTLGSASGIASLIMSFLSVAGIIWIGAFKLSGLEHDVKAIDKRLDKMENRLDKMDEKLNNIDVRVNLLEHRKP